MNDEAVLDVQRQRAANPFRSSQLFITKQIVRFDDGPEYTVLLGKNAEGKVASYAVVNICDGPARVIFYAISKRIIRDLVRIGADRPEKCHIRLEKEHYMEKRRL